MESLQATSQEQEVTSQPCKADDQRQTQMQVVTIQGRVHDLKSQKKRTFLILRSEGETLQCLIENTAKAKEGDSNDLKQQIKHLVPETIVRVTGKLQQTPFSIRSCTRESEELLVEAIEILSAPTRPLPFNLPDAERAITISNEVTAKTTDNTVAQPVVGQAQPVVGQAQPVVGQAQPVVG